MSYSTVRRRADSACSSVETSRAARASQGKAGDVRAQELVEQHTFEQQVADEENGRAAEDGDDLHEGDVAIIGNVGSYR